MHWTIFFKLLLGRGGRGATKGVLVWAYSRMARKNLAWGLSCYQISRKQLITSLPRYDNQSGMVLSPENKHIWPIPPCPSRPKPFTVDLNKRALRSLFRNTNGNGALVPFYSWLSNLMSQDFILRMSPLQVPNDTKRYPLVNPDTRSWTALTFAAMGGHVYVCQVQSTVCVSVPTTIN